MTTLKFIKHGRTKGIFITDGNESMMFTTTAPRPSVKDLEVPAETLFLYYNSSCDYQTPEDILKFCEARLGCDSLPVSSG